MMDQRAAENSKPRTHYEGVKDAIIWGLSFIAVTAVLIMLFLSLYLKHW